jgi:hypothetical protein
MSLDYEHKYRKYKNKYIYLQKQIRGGGIKELKKQLEGLQSELSQLTDQKMKSKKETEIEAKIEEIKKECTPKTVAPSSNRRPAVNNPIDISICSDMNNSVKKASGLKITESERKLFKNSSDASRPTESTESIVPRSTIPSTQIDSIDSSSILTRRRAVKKQKE